MSVRAIGIGRFVTSDQDILPIANLPFTTERVRITRRPGSFAVVHVRSRTFGIEAYIPEVIGGQWWLFFKLAENRRGAVSVRHQKRIGT